MESFNSHMTADDVQKKKPATNLESLPTELRQMIHSHTLGQARVFHSKTEFTRGNLLRPFDDQWLVPIGTRTAGAMRVNKDMNKLYYDEIMKCAVSGSATKIVVHVNDFDFRPLAKFLEPLSEKVTEKIKATWGNKLAALLSVANNEDEKCANNLRAWFNFRKEIDRRVPVTYYFGDVANRTLDMIKMVPPWKSYPGADYDIDDLLSASIKLEVIPEASEREVQALYEEIAVWDSVEDENNAREILSRTVKAFKENEDRKQAREHSVAKEATSKLELSTVAPSEVLKLQSNQKDLASHALVYGGAFHDESDDGSFHDGSDEESLDEDANENDIEDEQDVPEDGEEEEAGTGGSEEEDDDEWMTDTDDDADPECEGEMAEVKEWQVEKFGKELNLPSSRSGGQER